MARAATWGMVTSGHKMLPETMSGSMVLVQLRPMLMTVAHGSTEAYTDDWGLGHNLWHCWYPRPSCHWVQAKLGGLYFLTKRTMVLSGPSFLYRAMTGSLTQKPPESELISGTPITTKGYVNACVLCS